MFVHIEWICAFLILNPSLSHTERKLKEGIKEEGKDFLDQISNLMEDLGKAGDMLRAPRSSYQALCSGLSITLYVPLSRCISPGSVITHGWWSWGFHPSCLPLFLFLPPSPLPPSSFPSPCPPPPSLLHLPLPLLLLWKWVLVDQSCLSLCDPMDCSLPGSSSIHGILQARMLEWL